MGYYVINVAFYRSRQKVYARCFWRYAMLYKRHKKDSAYVSTVIIFVKCCPWRTALVRQSDRYHYALCCL